MNSDFRIHRIIHDFIQVQETPGVRSAMHAASQCYLEGGPLLWILPLNLHFIQKSDDDDDDDIIAPG